MAAVVKSTNIAGPGRRTGIAKQPTPGLRVEAPGPNYGDGSGVVGDFIGDSAHHGGAQKAVYAYEREELDFWGAHLGRTLIDGHFGENLTTQGINLADLVLGQNVNIGTAVLQVSVPRTPCRTFATHIGEPGWVKTWSKRERPGSYFRVITPGEIHPGDTLDLQKAPAHGITMGDAFRAHMGSREHQRAIVAAEALPELWLARYRERL